MNKPKQKTYTALDKFLDERAHEITDGLTNNFLSTGKHSADRIVQIIYKMATSESVLLALLEITENDRQISGESYLAKYEDDFRKILESYTHHNLSHSEDFKKFQSHINKVIKK